MPIAIYRPFYPAFASFYKLMDRQVALRTLVALAIGLIVGMERGWQSRDEKTGLRSVGLRSFGFVSLLGALTALLSNQFGPIFIAVAFLGLSTFAVVSYVLTAQASKDYGITTELTLLLTFNLGALAMLGWTVEVIGISIIISLLLGFKQELHYSLEQLDKQELAATLQLLLLAAVVLPLLPNQDLGPWQSINPRSIGILVLLIAGISYVGYFTMSYLGDRIGIAISGILGGLASSTALTVAFARMARTKTSLAPLLAAGIALATGMMVPRLWVELFAVNRLLLPQIVRPTVALALVTLVAAIVISCSMSKQFISTTLALDNPLQLQAVLGYAIILTLMFVLVGGTSHWLGNAGVYAIATVSGITDVDAVSLSIARATTHDLSLSTGSLGILLAVWSNTLVKVAIASVVGGKTLGRWCAGILVV
ncbi:MAG: MgtC/SapB family protein, partial [Cyanobacteria bacterium P01_E01_bin.34]